MATNVAMPHGVGIDLIRKLIPSSLMDQTMPKLILLMLLVTAAVGQERKIKPGDAIDIVVYGHQELSRVVTVNANGAIDFPFMQNVPVDGLTLEKLREMVVTQLSHYLNAYPVVTMSFSKSTSMTVHVLGMVAHPGIISVPLGSTLQGALAAAGGALPGARQNQVTVMQEADGRVLSTPYNLEKFLLEGDLKQNPVLSDGDRILLTGNPTLATVKVVGAVHGPGAFELVAGATVLDLLLRAGGPSEEANLEKVRVVSSAANTIKEYKIDFSRAVSSPAEYQLPLMHPGDIIFVPKKKNLWRGILSVARDVSTLTIALYYIFKFKE